MSFNIETNNESNNEGKKKNDSPLFIFNIGNFDQTINNQQKSNRNGPTFIFNISSSTINQNQTTNNTFSNTFQTNKIENENKNENEKNLFGNQNVTFGSKDNNWSFTSTNEGTSGKSKSNTQTFGSSSLNPGFSFDFCEKNDINDNDEQVIKKKRDPNAPKKPRTAYLFYSNETRPILKTIEPPLLFGELGKRLGHMWKELNEEEKEPYLRMAEEDKERYKKEIEEYERRNKEENNEQK